MSMIRSTLCISNFEKTGLHIEITLLPHFSLSLGQDIFYDNKFFYSIYFYSPQLQRGNVLKENFYQLAEKASTNAASGSGFQSSHKALRVKTTANNSR